MLKAWDSEDLHTKREMIGGFVLAQVNFFSLLINKPII